MAALKIKQIYEKPDAKDGFRILVDRIWPRGMKKEEAGIDEWIKDIAPSSELRKWFNHDPEKWKEFKEKYIAELKESAALEEFKDLLKKHTTVTLLYSAKDEEHNQAVVLWEHFKKKK